jgi:hypothetical protein
MIMRFRPDRSSLRLVDVFLMLFVMFLVGWAGDAFAEKGPDAFLPQTVYDFGTALEGNPVVHDFVIQNRGDEPLLIHRVRTG